jgi:DNA-binding NtrC family response regulator
VHDQRVDVRLVAATHRDIAALIRQDKFRQDLYFRISTLPLRIPPLRERPEDIPMIAQQLLQDVAAEMGREHIELTRVAHEELKRYQWPGNIRELRNMLERAVLLSSGNVLDAGDLHFDTMFAQPVAAGPDTRLTLAETERRQIEAVLREEGGNVPRAAERLDVPRSTLYKKVKALGLG